VWVILYPPRASRRLLLVMHVMSEGNRFFLIEANQRRASEIVRLIGDKTRAARASNNITKMVL
jgi:hypothetical protein